MNESLAETRDVASRVARWLVQKERPDEAVGLLVAWAARGPNDAAGQALLAEALRIDPGAKAAQQAFEQMEGISGRHAELEAAVRRYDEAELRRLQKSAEGPTFRGAQIGFNNNIRAKDQVFHIQTEDSGLNQPHVITHLFADGGRVVKSHKRNYGEAIEREVDIGAYVKKLMKAQHLEMVFALRDGRFDEILAGRAVGGLEELADYPDVDLSRLGGGGKRQEERKAQLATKAAAQTQTAEAAQVPQSPEPPRATTPPPPEPSSEALAAPATASDAPSAEPSVVTSAAEIAAGSVTDRGVEPLAAQVSPSAAGSVDNPASSAHARAGRPPRRPQAPDIISSPMDPTPLASPSITRTGSPAARSGASASGPERRATPAAGRPRLASSAVSKTLRGGGAGPNVGQTLRGGVRRARRPSPSPPRVPQPARELYTLHVLRCLGGGPGRYEVARRETVIGSGGEIKLPNEPFCHPREASLSFIDGRLWVDRLEGHNGVFLRMHKPVALQFGEEFIVGDQLLRVEENPISDDAPDPAPTYFYSSPRWPSAFRLVQIFEGGARGACLVARGSTLQVGSVIGDLILGDDPLVEPQHCVVEEQAGTLILTDLQSRNGVFLKIHGRQELVNGDEIVIGRTHLVVSIPGSA